MRGLDEGVDVVVEGITQASVRADLAIGVIGRRQRVPARESSGVHAHEHAERAELQMSRAVVARERVIGLAVERLLTPKPPEPRSKLPGAKRSTGKER